MKRSMIKQMYSNKNVLEVSKERISFLFDNFKNICVSISGGKDSTVLAYLTLKEAVKSQVLTLRYIEGILINWAQNGVKERYIDEKPQERKVKESHYHWWEDE